MFYNYDPDYRKEPKTNKYCCRCQKDIKNHKSAIDCWIDPTSFRLSFEKPASAVAHPQDCPEGWLPAKLGKECKKHLTEDNRVF